MFRPVFLLCACLPLPAFANCVPPYHTLFACQINERQARAEFCTIADPAAHPDLKQGYYSYAVGTDEAELYFETDRFRNQTEELRLAPKNSGDPPDEVTRIIGYQHDAYVYSFRLTLRPADRHILGAEVRVHPSMQAFSEDLADGALERLLCDEAQTIADFDRILAY